MTDETSGAVGAKPIGTASGPAARGLRRDAVGLREVLFQSITAMAPGAAVAASIPAGAAWAGGSLPLAVLAALVACLFTANSVAELARHMPAAGSVATYSAQGLHPAVGFLVAWGYVAVQAMIPTLLLLQLGFTTAGTLSTEWHGYPAGLWWPWALAGAVVIGLAGVYGIRGSARLGTVLGAFEIAVFVVFAVLLIVDAGGHNTLSVFGTGHTPAAHHGLSGVIAGSVYTVLAFAGFEAAAPLAEEAADPRRTVRRAVLGAAVAIGAVYVLTTYAMDVYFGPGRFSGFGTDGPASWGGVARASYGLLWLFVFLAVVNSTIANANAGANVSTRTGFALGRIGVLPRGFAYVSERHRSPLVAVGVQFAIAVGATLAIGLGFGPVNGFLLVATAIVVVVVSVYIVVNLACVGYFLRRRRSDFRVLRHLVLPVLGVLVLIPALLTAAGIPAFSFIARLTAPVSYAGPAVLVWMALGVLLLAWLWARHRQSVLDTARVHAEE
ncbi:APC family permease [Phaeacidiphilus oryzae]|uniref:APC family permease n=1 Tax=Phaeacidiphilus oryzae TaxID=348818 RepID=UPI000A05CD77|nr:APC family permease [Phaeacidiphilus oryzae]